MEVTLKGFVICFVENIELAHLIGGTFFLLCGDAGKRDSK